MKRKEVESTIMDAVSALEDGVEYNVGMVKNKGKLLSLVVKKQAGQF